MGKIPRGDYVGQPMSIAAPTGFWPNIYSNSVYDSVEFTVATGQTNRDIKTDNGGWVNVTTARHIMIRTDQEITVRFNAAVNDPITIGVLDSPFYHDTLDVTNVFITNASGSTANVKIILT